MADTQYWNPRHETMPRAELEALQDAMAAKHRFEITQHLLRIIGVCVDCRRARKHNPNSHPS